MKRILTLVIVLAMLVSISGLALNETGYPICDEVVTITMAGQNTNTLNWNDTDQIAEIEARLGIKIVGTSYEPDAWKNQFTLMLAGEELPDLIVSPNITLVEANELAAQGYFLDMTEYIEKYGENIKHYEEEYPYYRAYNTAPDGGIYTLNEVNPNVIGQIPRVFLNKAWMDNLDLEYPETIDELTDILRSFRDEDANGNGDPNDEIPFSSTDFYNALASLMSAFGIYNVNGNSYLLQVDDEGTLYLADTTENYRAFLTWMNLLWDEGLLDIDNFVQTNDEIAAKAAADRLGMFAHAAPFVACGKGIDYDANFYWIGGLTSEWNDTPTVVKSSPVSAKPRVLVNAKTEHPDEIVRFLDYLFTEEGTLCAAYGYEGVTFDAVPLAYEGLEGYSIATMRQPEGWASAEEYRYKKATCNDVFNIVRSFTGTFYPAVLAASDELLEEMVKDYGWAVRVTQNAIRRCEVIETFPSLIYNADEATTQNQLYTDISLCLASMQAQFITGKVDVSSDADWEAYLNQLDTMKLDDLLAIEQAAYDRLFK